MLDFICCMAIICIVVVCVYGTYVEFKKNFENHTW